MKTQIRNYAIVAILGALVGATITHVFFFPDITEREEVVYTYETKIDWVPKDTLIIRDSLRILEIEPETQPSPEPEKYDSIRTYTGTEKHLYGVINWRVKTGGYLQHLELNPNLKIPIVTNTNTIERKTAYVVEPKGLYFTGGINSRFNYSVGLTYLNNKSLFSGRYAPQTNTFEIATGMKIF